MSCRDDDVFGHAAVSAQPDAAGRRIPAFVVAAGETGDTTAASDDAVNRNGVAALEPAHAGSQRFDPARVFMAERERHRHAGASGASIM